MIKVTFAGPHGEIHWTVCEKLNGDNLGWWLKSCMEDSYGIGPCDEEYLSSKWRVLQVEGGF